MQRRHLCVHLPDGRLDGQAVNLADLPLLHRVAVEAVVHVVELPQGLPHGIDAGVEGQGALAVEAHQVLELAKAAQVVVVRVGEEDVVEVAHVLADKLVAHVGRGVDEDGAVALDEHAAAAAAQARVLAGGLAGLAVAEERGHAAAAGGPQEGEGVLGRHAAEGLGPAGIPARADVALVALLVGHLVPAAALHAAGVVEARAVALCHQAQVGM